MPKTGSWLSGIHLNNIGSTAIDGAAVIGKASEIQGLVVSHLFCLPPICLGLYLLLRPILRTERTKGRITDKPACTVQTIPRCLQPFVLWRRIVCFLDSCHHHHSVERHNHHRWSPDGMQRVHRVYGRTGQTTVHVHHPIGT